MKNQRIKLSQTVFKLSLIIIMLLNISCESEDDDSTNDDLQEIEQFLTPETVQALEDIGFNRECKLNSVWFFRSNEVLNPMGFYLQI
jgi:ABC-type protease/lipase transport system fused ATPase/permease subunit